MAESTPARRPAAGVTPRVVHRITVDPEVSMVELLGRGDEVLLAIEAGFRAVDIHARGNEISLAGPAGDVALVAELVDELIEVAATGTPLTPDRSEEHV